MAKHVRHSHNLRLYRLSNQSKEQILLGMMMSVCGKADQIFRPVTREDWGIDGEVEFRDNRGRASGHKIYVQLKCGESYLRRRKSDGKLIFSDKNSYHLHFWLQQPVDVYLVIGKTDETVSWMNITRYLMRRHDKNSRQIIFSGECLDINTIRRLRAEVLRLK